MTKAKAKKEQEQAPVKKKRFGPFILVYAWLLLILGGAALFQLQIFLREYEDSQPEYVVAEYEKDLGSTVPQAAMDALDDLDPLTRFPDEESAWIQSMLQEATLRKDSTLSREDHLEYSIEAADGQTLGRVIFEPTDKRRFGLPVWAAKRESFDFSAYYRTEQIQVPSSYKVFQGNHQLLTRRIVEADIPYPLLEECYLHYKNLPTMVRYETFPFLCSSHLRVLDQDWQPVTAEQLNEDDFLNHCPQEVRERVELFVPEFVELYVFFSADIEDTAYEYFFKLRTMVVMPDSQLYTRMQAAFEGFGYSSTRSVKLLSTDIDRIVDLGRNRYLVELHYVTEVTGRKGPVPVEDHVLLVLRDVNGTLLADALYYQ